MPFNHKKNFDGKDNNAVAKAKITIPYHIKIKNNYLSRDM